MGHTVNGIGTEFIAGSGFVGWGGEEEDCDGVECFVILHLPIFPFKSRHTYDWSGNEYRYVDVRWSLGTVVGAYWRRYLWLPMIGAIFLGIFSLIEGYGAFEKGGLGHPDFLHAGMTLGMAFGIGALVIGGWRLHRYLDSRSTRIRQVLGPHVLGSSDPARWLPAQLEGLNPPDEVHGTSTFLAAVDSLVQEGRFSEAMWAARIGVAKEDPVKGEAATDRILRNTRVKDALRVVQANPHAWGEVMTVPEPEVEGAEDEMAAEA